MDVTLDVVLEQSKKVESTKRVQKMSDTSSQQLSSTSSKEKSLEVFSTLKSSNTGNVNNSSMASELNALNDSGKEIGEMVLQKPQQQSIMSSSSINTFGASSSSCLSLKQQTSSPSPEKPVCVEDEKKVESEKEKVYAILTCETGKSEFEDDMNNGNDSLNVKEMVTVLDKNHTENFSTEQDDGGETDDEEDEEENMDKECDSGNDEQVIDKVVENPYVRQTITSAITEHPNAKSITSEVIKLEAKTSIITTPTTEETKTVNCETKLENSFTAEVEVEIEDIDEDDDDEEVEMEKNIPTISVHQQLHEEQILPEAAQQKASLSSLQSQIATNQGNLNNTIMDIISNIDSNIIAEENRAALKQRDLELLKKQQELALEIQKQELLAQKLSNENRILQEEQKELTFSNKNTDQILSHKAKPHNLSKYYIYDDNQDENKYSRQTETIETRESTNISKKIDLQKIFSPATDVEEILPKNRKLFASSAFYSPTLHPTVEDQVELARKISHSLSDFTNHQSKGQSMYVNRKKRSVKWVHEGCGQGDAITTSVEIQTSATDTDDSVQADKENDGGHTLHCDKVPLKCLMNPRGQMRDINSCQESINTETGLLSLDTSAEVLNALQTHKGKGAELFAKRRKVSKNWVVDDSNVGTHSPSGLPDNHQFQQQSKPSTSPSILPAFTDAAKHRVQLNMHQEQLLEKYTRPGLKVVKTPWNAALESGSANAAFVEDRYQAPQYFVAMQGVQSHDPIYIPTEADCRNKPFSPDTCKEYKPQQPQNQYKLPMTKTVSQASGTIPQRDLAYKPCIPQGWKAPNMSLPSDLYVPQEIPLQSYVPPPVATTASLLAQDSIKPSYDYFEHSWKPSIPPQNTYQPPAAASYPSPAPTHTSTAPFGGSGTFPLNKPFQMGTSTSCDNNPLTKQQYLAPQSYQSVPQTSAQNVPQLNYSPSPLPYEKLAKFENTTGDSYNSGSLRTCSPLRNTYLGSKDHNTTTALIGDSYQQAVYTPSMEANTSSRLLPQSSFISGNITQTPHTIFNSRKLLNAPSYNNSARGWQSSFPSAGFQALQQRPMIAQKPHASSMPYTDF